MRKTLAAVVVSAVALTGAAYAYGADEPTPSYQETLSQLGASVDSQIASLREQVATLTSERDALATDKASLEAERATLNARIADLETQLAACEPTSSPTLQVGTTASRLSGESWQKAYDRRVAYLGVEPEAVRLFYSGGVETAWPNLGSAVEIVSFKYAPTSVTAGNHDAALRAFFRAIPADGEEHIYAYYHEPEDNISDGQFTKAQFRNATAHIGNLENSVTTPEQKVTQATILMGYTVQTSSGRTLSDYYWPGIDALGWDIYTGDANDTKAKYALSANASKALGERYFIAEAGRRDSSNSLQAEHIDYSTRIAAELGFEYYTYFDATVGGNWLIDTTVERDAMANAINRDLPLGE